MKHAGTSFDTTEMAALYALGALSQQEARAFEDHLSACDECSAEVESFEATVSVLALADEQEPPPRARARLMAELNGGAKGDGREPEIDIAAIKSVHANDGEWIKVSEGIEYKMLHVDRQSRLITSLVRMGPGTALPMHRHQGVEQFFILEGDCNVHGERLGPGDFHRATPGSVHRDTYTVEGTLFLLIAPERFEVLSTL